MRCAEAAWELGPRIISPRYLIPYGITVRSLWVSGESGRNSPVQTRRNVIRKPLSRSCGLELDSWCVSDKPLSDSEESIIIHNTGFGVPMTFHVILSNTSFLNSTHRGEPPHPLPLIHSKYSVHELHKAQGPKLQAASGQPAGQRQSPFSPLKIEAASKEGP